MPGVNVYTNKRRKCLIKFRDTFGMLHCFGPFAWSVGRTTTQMVGSGTGTGSGSESGIGIESMSIFWVERGHECGLFACLFWFSSQRTN